MIKKRWSNRFIAVFLCLVLVVGLLTGCSEVKRVYASQLMNGEGILKEYDDIKDIVELDSDYLNGQSAFAHKIFAKLHDGENIVISPYSISLALSMLYNGADKETRDEMAKVLGYDLLKGYTTEYNLEANNYMNANNRLLMDDLRKVDEKVDIHLANAVWLSENGEFSDSIEESFLSPVRYYYDADIYKADFVNEKTLDDINAWVSNNTDGMIDPFLESLQNPERLRLLLVNSVYFNGQWKIPFEPKDTISTKFNGINGKTMVDMMYLHDEDFRYFANDNLRGIELPYGEGRIVMNVLLPSNPEKSTIHNIYENITMEEFDGFLSRLSKAPLTGITTLGIPKFEIEYGLKELNDELISLGMKKAFDEVEADFQNIEQDIFVGRVGHKAKIIVEEWGTKASAATGIEMKCTSAEMDPLLFIADVPFLFLIRDTVTNTILFMGELSQP